MRMRFSISLIATLLCAASLAQRQVEPRSGLVITESSRIKGGKYLIPNTSDDPWIAAITVRGDNMTVDFKGAEISGSTENAMPDQRKGTALRIEGANVTIKNAKIRGYRIAIIAEGAPGLKLIDCDLSYNWKQRLKSDIEREHLDDWMSYHQNDKDEWLRYGAAIYLNDCDGFEVKGCRATGGQCGLMVTSSDKGLAWNNEFTFLSGIGVGLYRSSDNRVMHNKIDFCVRGYSHNIYNRGQDSAGILVYEQSNRNVFAYNSATHGGDGFFLWAGQTTMDNGQGGCNDNLVYGNDFSHSPANGIEATFSRNTFANNLMRECWHGVWGGYSYSSVFLYNSFADNEAGISIEHGQDNAIRNNFFQRDKKAIEIWQNATQDPNWGYPKNRDTKSRDYTISGNFIGRAATGIDLRDTIGVRVVGNRFQLCDLAMKPQGNTKWLVFESNAIHGIPKDKIGMSATPTNTSSDTIELGMSPDWSPLALKELPADVKKLRPEPLKNAIDSFLQDGAIRGRHNIIVDEWGPYDFRSPRLWPEPPLKQTVEQAGRVPTEARGASRRFRVLGPPGKWRLVTSAGADSVKPESGDVPGELVATYGSEGTVDVALNLDYEGEATVDTLGNWTAAGKAVRFGYSMFHAPIEWSVKFFAWDKATDPRTKPDAFAKLIAGKPLHKTQTDELDYQTTRPFVRDLTPPLPTDNFATVAEGTTELPEGNYRLEVTSDDGCRVWIDGKKVLDEWRYQGPTTFTVPLSGGKHRIRVEHFEIDGWAALRVLVKKS